MFDVARICIDRDRSSEDVKKSLGDRDQSRQMSATMPMSTMPPAMHQGSTSMGSTARPSFVEDPGPGPRPCPPTAGPDRSMPVPHQGAASMPAFPPTAGPGAGACPGPAMRSQPPPPPPAPPRPPQRELSPVSAYVEGECAREEIPIVAQLKQRNRELKARLGMAQDRVEYIPEVEARVSGHLERLRQAMAESRALQVELARLQETLNLAEQSSGGKVAGGVRDMDQLEEESSHEQMCKALQEEIDAITEENHKLINTGDSKVFDLETELSAEHRRQHIADVQPPPGPASTRAKAGARARDRDQLVWSNPSDSIRQSQGSLQENNTAMSLRMPASFRSVTNSPPAANNQEAAENPMTQEQANELRELGEKILQKEEELREYKMDEYDFEAETTKVFVMTQQMQLDEINQFRKMLEDKRQRLASDALPASNALELLKAEYEHLDSHVGTFKKESEEAHDQAMETAAELRRQIASLRVEQGIASSDFEAAKVKIEEAKRSSWESSALAEREHTDLREKCEEVKKEIERSEMRVDFLSLKKTELEEEAVDLHERSAFIMKSLPPMEPGVVEEAAAATEAKLAGLQKQRSELSKLITTTRKRDTDLNMIVVRAKEDFNVAMMQKEVMTNKLKTLEERESRVPRTVPNLSNIA